MQWQWIDAVAEAWVTEKRMDQKEVDRWAVARGWRGSVLVGASWAGDGELLPLRTGGLGAEAGGAKPEHGGTSCECRAVTEKLI